jgi:hypothetical protein
VLLRQEIVPLLQFLVFFYGNQVDASVRTDLVLQLLYIIAQYGRIDALQEFRQLYSLRLRASCS